MVSNHYTDTRKQRENIINNIGIGNIIASFIIDRHHPNGPEIHKITSTGIIIIYNLYTGKMVTKLIARPNQIKRYYEEGKAPQYLLELAAEHQAKGYNKM